MAKLSIVIPVYNVAAYIEKCMHSVVNQTLTDIEIIIVNDGTKDNSMELCQPFIESDDRIVVINKQNGGLMSAWMAGVNAATSEYVGFVDSDDWIDLDYFENLYTEICKHEADVVVGQFVYEYPSPYVMKREKSAVYTGKDEVYDLVEHYFKGFACEEPKISYCRWDKLYKRELLINNMRFFNRRVSLGEDVNTNATVLPDCNKIVVLKDTAKYHYRINQTSIVNTFKESTMDEIVDLYNTLRNVSEAKQYSLEPVNAFVGNMVFEEICNIIRQSGLSFSTRKQYIYKVLGKCPENVLTAFAELRDSFFIKIYCNMLQHGAVTTCMLVRLLFDKTASR